MVEYIAGSSDLWQNEGLIYPFGMLQILVFHNTFDPWNPVEKKNP